jgi:DNA helicase-2/ATP-dependent DNA helicase PcrA
VPNPPQQPADDSPSDPSPLLRGLNPAQVAAVTSGASPLRILAGAGSGKTRVLTHRIAHHAAEGLADPTRTLAVTFTRKAAGELRARLSRLGLRSGVQAGTFHAIAYAQLRQRWEERGVRPPELLDRKVGFVARLLPSRRQRTLPLDVVAEIEWASARLVDPESYVAAASSAHRRPPLELQAVAEVYQRYREAKRERRLVDFDDLLRLAARDLDVDPVYAQARRWRFRHLYVDEFQDVNPLQHRLLTAWLGPDSTLCVVGDPNQAIYAWNGADARFLVDFDRWFPGGETVTLSDNYRSTPEILAAANGVLAAGPSRLLRLRANRASARVPEVHALPDEVAEARAVVRRCRDRRRPGDPWRAQAVLVRTNAQAAVLAEAFTAAGVPFRVRGAGSLLEQPEVRQALDLLRGSTSVTSFLADVEREVHVELAAPPLEAVPSAAAEPEPVGPSLTDDRRANLAELVRLGREYLALDPGGSTAAFSAWLRSTLLTEDSAGTDAVDIVTFHAAKGLEWPVVHVAGLEKGFVPIHHADDDTESLEEERRLLYVALTRARDELWCTWAQRRAFGSRSLRRAPSPWIDAMLATSGAHDRPAPEDRARAARDARASRRRSPMQDGAEEQLFQALRAWRRERAAGADVPAFVIFNDVTLREVARRRPIAPADLLEIPGIGTIKAERFGTELLRLVAEAGSQEASER